MLKNFITVDLVRKKDDEASERPIIRATADPVTWVIGNLQTIFGGIGAGIGGGTGAIVGALRY